MTDEQPKQPAGQPNQRPNPPVISRSLEDFSVPGVMIEVSPDEAEKLGAFEETALSEEDAWESNGDPVEDYDQLLKLARAPNKGARA